MKMKNLTENIHNLTSLWQIAGTASGQYTEDKRFSHSLVPGAQWPNRIWLNRLADRDSIEEMSQVIKHSNHVLSISYWDDFKSDAFELFEKRGFLVKSEQIGMSLELKMKFEHQKRVQLKRIVTDKEAAIWENIYPQSFGYVISAATILHTKKQINYYLVYLDTEPIGTAITYETGTVIGIHGMGIVPTYRKQGLAEEVILKLLNQAIDGKKNLATLQASAMGKNIYKNVGFSQDFVMKNYVLRKSN